MRGKGTAPTKGAVMSNVLVRPRRGKIIAGVCAALAERFGLPAFLVRVGFVIFGVTGIGEIVYLVLWIMIPKER
ncbi:phage shock protein C (PspC) family protein [Ornithinimicrobium cerasi]|uniref:Phage shock protein C (PspC) family protein n=2 Tax=Ornithinimicrobium cerasi TaxID=2248773 RepID=A0A285VXA1_9MICO|nr:phage shock protein C (PspC) family protein [Ornithinimicrobium cerasi]